MSEVILQKIYDPQRKRDVLKLVSLFLVKKGSDEGGLIICRLGNPEGDILTETEAHNKYAVAKGNLEDLIEPYPCSECGCCALSPNA